MMILCSHSMIRFKLFYLFSVICNASFIHTELLSLPDCSRQCVNPTIPFPSGMSSVCYFDESFHIICNSSLKPPKPYQRLWSAEVVCISLDGKLELIEGGSAAPTVARWAADALTSHVSRNSASHYACRSLQRQGYICLCLLGYQGNPYLVDGRQGVFEDINDRADSNPCVGVCTNFLGSFEYCCPEGLVGDGRKNGNSCHRQHQITGSGSVSLLPMSIFFVAPLLLSMWVVYVEENQRRETNAGFYFKLHGGELLERELSRTSQQLTIYTREEMKLITNNYRDRNVMLGCKPGVFYRGALPTGKAAVAVMLIEVVPPQSHIKDFVDQIIFLSQPHRNLVRILGCCMETEFPFIVYELHGDGNTTLFDCTRSSTAPPFSREMRVKAAKGVAKGLAYFNSYKWWASFVHGNICSANVLVDGSYNPKIFYAAGSNLVIEEYASSSQDVYRDPEPLNKKSDVYSFGVVLVELLTGRGADISPNMGRNDLLRLLEILRNETIGQRGVVKDVAELAERCLNAIPGQRPYMKEVSKKLTSLLEMV